MSPTARTIATKATRVEKGWRDIRPILIFDDERGYEHALAWVEFLMNKKKHPLYDLLDLLVPRVEEYERKHHPIPDASGADVLRFLMEQHGLAQGDIPEIGTQSVVSEVLSGKRRLNVGQIERLAARFHVSPAVFLAGGVGAGRATS
jgi:HTH-type transcriptional regulator / antitoxin HigA